MEIMAWAYCCSDKTGDSIWCGTDVESEDGTTYNITDTGMLYATLEEAFWELCQEFEEGVSQANALQEEDSSLTYEQALAAVFGHFSLSFKVDGQTVDLDIDTNADEFMYSLLSNL